MSNPEEGIAKIQAAAAKQQTGKADGLQKVQKWSVAYLDERIFIYLFAIVLLGLVVVWATATSAWIHYGSLVLAIMLTIIWGIARIYSVNRMRRERVRQAKDWSSDAGRGGRGKRHAEN